MLGIMYRKMSDDPLHQTRLNKTWTSLSDIAAELEIDPKVLKRYHEGFHSFGKGNDHVRCEDRNGVFMIGLEERGLAAYLDDYWLREGQKELNERIYDITKWLLPVIAILITAGSLGFTVYTTVQNKNKIETIQKELDTIKQQQKPDTLFGSYFPFILFSKPANSAHAFLKT